VALNDLVKILTFNKWFLRFYHSTPPLNAVNDFSFFCHSSMQIPSIHQQRPFEPPKISGLCNGINFSLRTLNL
jgi:hypothetical protein